MTSYHYRLRRFYMVGLLFYLLHKIFCIFAIVLDIYLSFFAFLEVLLCVDLYLYNLSCST